MTKTDRSLGLLLTLCWFAACAGGASQHSTGVAGNPGGGGGGAGATGSAGQPGDASVASDGPVHPNDAGRCPMQGAYPRGGICLCQTDTPDVCSNVCVNIQTDNDHCGDCATKCPTTTVCNAGKCSAPPTVVLAAPVPAAASCGPLRLAGAGTTLYWTDTLKGTVSSMPAAGGSPTIIASGQAAPTHLQVVGGTVFWLARGEKKIMKLVAGAGTPALVVAAPATDAQIGGFAVSADGLTVYFSTSKIDTMARPQSAISKVPAAGGASTVLAEQDHGVPAAVAVDGTFIAFPVNGNGDVNAISFAAGAVAKCGMPAPDGGEMELDVNCNRLGRSQGQLFLDDVFAFGGSAYWLDGGQLKINAVASSGTYDVIALSPGSNAFSAFTMGGTTTAFLVEEGARNCMTWKDGISGGTCLANGPATPAIVGKTPLVANSTVVPLARIVDPRDATQAALATSVAVVGEKVYYATGDCAILSVAK